MEKAIRAIITFILLGVLLFAAGWGLVQYVLSRDVAEVRKEQELKAKIALYEAQTEYNRSYVKAQKALAAIRALDAVKQEPWYGYTRLLGESFLNLWPVWILLVGVVIAWFQRGRFTTFENFEFDGIKTVIPPNQIVRLTELAIRAKALQSYTEVQVSQENRLEHRIRNDAAIFRSLRSGSVSLDPFVTEQDQLHGLHHYVPSFTELLRQGEIGQGRPLIFGYGKDFQLRTGNWYDLFSNATGGTSGSGKTSTLRGLIGQSVLQGVQFWIHDEHFPHPESLLASIGPLKDLPYIKHTDNMSLSSLLKDIDETITRRLSGQESSLAPKVFVIDEVLEAIDRYPAISKIIKRIATAGRKVKVYGLFSAQTWLANEVGGSSLRDNLTSRIVHSMTRNQANTLLQDNELAKLCPDLQPGEMLFSPVNGKSEILRVPYCIPADMDAIYQLVSNGDIVTIPGVNLPHINQSVNQPVNQGVNLTEPGEGELINQINARLQSGLKQKEFAGLIGVSSSMLSQILSGKKNVSLDLADRIKKALQIDKIINLEEHRKK